MSQNSKKGGFTLIELMLAMTFVSILLIAIAMTVIQISGIYNRGMMLKGINQSGRSVTDEIKRGIAASSSFDINNSTDYVNQNWGGRLCMGKYSYMWNYGSAITTGKAVVDRNKYTDSQYGEIRFVKVYDPGKTYCALGENGYPGVVYADAIDLLNASQYNFAIQAFSIKYEASAFDSKTGQRLYNIEFTLGTNDQEALNDTHTSCKASGEAGSDINYCSTARFNITVRSGSSVE